MAAFLLGLATAVAARAAAPASPPVVLYTIEVSLDPSTHQLDGRQRLLWRNPSGDAISELRFHTYLNAFKNNRSTFVRESGGQLRGDRPGAKAGDWGWIDVLSIKTADGRDLRPESSYVQPDGNDPADETVLAVPLPSPVPAHGQILLDIAFKARLPKVFARTGHVRDYYLVGQWFPKIGVYEPAGMRQRPAGGWNCHAFHANSEFYADYGSFDVTFTVPSDYVVGATGKRVSQASRGGRTTYRYVQENVHDFAWTADPHFLVHEFRFEPPRDIPAGWSALASSELGLSEAEIALKPVSIRLLLQPGHQRARDRYVLSARQALSYYGLWYGAYPYETLTIVDPPEDGRGSGGMEYPTFFTVGTFGVPLRWPFDRVRVVEDVTIHEFGHEYWYGMVGSNEFEEAWLDEGLNTDSEYRLMRLAYGPREASLPGGIGFDLYSLAHAANA
ncbi:MAG: M1 family metallopeptidase, partial [Thermoanaerobaculia bacterium]